jgi:type III secretion protein V
VAADPIIVKPLKKARVVRRTAWWRQLPLHSDLLLVALVVAVIALMVLPLPPFMLDTLIALNLTISVVLLMVSLYIRSPLGLSTFPSLLLFTTLFRLALNIASTRQILLNAYAGDIILTRWCSSSSSPRARSVWPRSARVFRSTRCRASR